ncbi:MAG: SdrD B-like domain-containing protein, partial [Longimicrobiales bacterium]
MTPTRLLAPALVLAGTLLPAACDARPDELAGIDATGGLAGVVYIDRDGDGVLETTDAGAADVRVELVPAGRDVAVDSARTTTDGAFLFESVPVGVYGVRVAPADVPDSLVVTDIDSASVTVPAGAAPVVVIALSYPSATTAAARSATAGTRLFVTGVALSAWGTFGDSTMHVRDETGALRLVRVEPVAVAIGDT